MTNRNRVGGALGNRAWRPVQIGSLQFCGKEFLQNFKRQS
jgi:hypothetical protein